MDVKEQRKNKWRHSVKNRKQYKPKQCSSTEEKPNTETVNNDKENTIIEIDESKDRDLPPNYFANLKRETDEILNITKSYSRREIATNWSKYEIPSESNEEDGSDFSCLLNAPVSSGGHFRFKSEKEWDAKSTSATKYNNYFTLNMKTLSEGLNCIPFYKRHGIDENMFSNEDIRRMNNKSQIYLTKYEPVLKSSKVAYKKKKPNKSDTVTETIQNKIISIIRDDRKPVEEGNDTTKIDNSQKIEEITNALEIVEKIEENDDIQIESETVATQRETECVEIKTFLDDSNADAELDDLLNLKAPDNPAISLTNNIVADSLPDEPEPAEKALPLPNSTVDLETWLDDILDD